MHHTISLVLERETKGAVRYQELDANGDPRRSGDEESVVGTLYIRKKAIHGAIPTGIRVTIEAN